MEISVDGSSKHVINLHPTSEELGRVYLEIIHSAGWNGFTVMYENAPWLDSFHVFLYKKIKFFI